MQVVLAQFTCLIDLESLIMCYRTALLEQEGHLNGFIDGWNFLSDGFIYHIALQLRI